MVDFGFGIGGWEILLIAFVAIVVVGPKDLPKVLRAMGKTLANLRSMGSEFQRHLDGAMRDTGLDEMRREVSDLKQLASAEVSRQSENFMKAQQEVADLVETTPAIQAPVLPSLPEPVPAPVQQPIVKTPVVKKSVTKKPAAKKPAAKKATAKQPTPKKAQAKKPAPKKTKAAAKKARA
jgi:sec-independent protein translocase protein TatB